MSRYETFLIDRVEVYSLSASEAINQSSNIVKECSHKLYTVHGFYLSCDLTDYWAVLSEFVLYVLTQITYLVQWDQVVGFDLATCEVVDPVGLGLVGIGVAPGAWLNMES